MASIIRMSGASMTYCGIVTLFSSFGTLASSTLHGLNLGGWQQCRPYPPPWQPMFDPAAMAQTTAATSLAQKPWRDMASLLYRGRKDAADGRRRTGAPGPPVL